MIVGGLTLSSVAGGLIVFASVFGGALCGILLRGALPSDHLSSESKDVVKMSMGLVTTMAALVLGLLVSSAKSFYDAQSNELTQMSARVILLDRILAHYGTETKDVRDLLRRAIADSIDRVWPEERSPSKPGVPSTGPEALLDKIQELSPKDEKQHALQSQALSAAAGLIQTRWLMYEQETNSISVPMLVILISWLAAVFTSFGLFAPRNATVIIALFVAGGAVSGAIFLILEMYAPFGGLIKLSSAPMRTALTQLGQ